jgi:hypothetical protein
MLLFNHASRNQKEAASHEYYISKYTSLEAPEMIHKSASVTTRWLAKGGLLNLCKALPSTLAASCDDRVRFDDAGRRSPCRVTSRRFARETLTGICRSRKPILATIASNNRAFKASALHLSVQAVVLLFRCSAV